MPAAMGFGCLMLGVPQVESLLNDRPIEVHVVAVGERPPVVCVPAEAIQLPPTSWQKGLLRHNRALLFDTSPPPSRCSACGLPPSAPSEDLELLRLECVLPPATKAAAGERALRASVRAVADDIWAAIPVPCPTTATPSPTCCIPRAARS